MPAHPKFTPWLDKFRNLFLRKQECCICYGEARAFRFECDHAVCCECMQSYLGTSLGDVSMFPLKCPMHHQGCTTVIGPEIAKRMMNREEYERFIGFHDRAILGEGIHCLKCNFFVNLPSNAANPMVQCPYCRFRFCYRCKTAWHTGLRCEERPDTELEEWRRSQGAQRCPGCYKIIEKDDPETCNHMVHKATDSMPCLRDRTDFCCELIAKLNLIDLENDPILTRAYSQTAVGWRSYRITRMKNSTVRGPTTFLMACSKTAEWSKRASLR